MPRDQLIKALEEILANKDMIQKVRDLDFNKEVQVKYEINELKARKDEELEYIILRNRHLGRPDRDGEETEESIKKKKNKLKNLFVTELIDLLIELDEVIKDCIKTLIGY